MASVSNKDTNGKELSVEEMIRKFKKKVQNQGIIEDYRKYDYYIPKSTKRRLKSEKHRKLMAKYSKY